MPLAEYAPFLGPIIEIIKLLIEQLDIPKDNGKTGVELVLIELYNNLDQINTGLQQDTPIQEVIKALKLSTLKANIDLWLKQDSFPEEPIDIHLLFDDPDLFYYDYDGWEPKKLILNIFQKMDNLKTIVENYSDLSRFNLKARLRNLSNLTVLLFLHLQYLYEKEEAKKKRRKHKIKKTKENPLQLGEG